MNTATGITAGHVRRLTGVSRSQLRYWEAHQIITPLLVPHVSRNWRVYPAEQIERISRIRNLLAMGMSLQGAVKRLDHCAPVNQQHPETEILAIA